MKILGIIPARKGSKGIPGKNTKLLNGKPLINYSIEQALKSSLDKVVVSTDCDRVIEICKNYEIDFINRPARLSTDRSTTLSVLQHALGSISDSFDAIMTLQPTSPMRNYVHINESIELFCRDLNADCLVSVVKTPHNFIPEKIMTFSGVYLSGNATIIRRQDAKEYYARNGAAIYITKKEILKTHIISGNILPYFMGKMESFDIDDIDDWNIVESILKCNPPKN
jgi:CMP-N,N'-diacetyllegionaminic acid synthase